MTAARSSDADALTADEWVGGAVHLCAAAVFVVSRAAEGLYYRILPADVPWRTGPPWWVVFGYVVVTFALYAALNAIVQRVLAARAGGAWSWRRWAVRTAEHGVPFVVGACLVVMTQVLFELRWFFALSAVLLVLFAATHAARRVLAGDDADDAGDTVTWRTTLLAYAWTLAGLGVSTLIVPERLTGTATYVGWLTLTMSAWTMLTVPPALRAGATRPAARHVLRLAAWTPQLLWRRPVGWKG